LKLLGNRLQEAKHDATDLSGALSDLNGWFDRRQALRDYRDAIHDLSKGLKDGFGRKDVENLDAAGRSILQVAEGIKDPALKADFLAGARASLVDLAEHAGPKASTALQKVIDKMDSEGLTHPPAIPLRVDDKASPTLEALGIKLRRTAQPVTAPVRADTSQATAALSTVATMLRNLNGSSATTYVRTVRSDIPLPGRSADGGTVPKTGKPYADRHLYLLADGEEIISNRFGQADRFRADRAAGRIPGYADGGTVASTHTSRSVYNASDPLQVLVDHLGNVGAAANGAASGLKGLKSSLDKAEKALDREKSKLEELTSRRDSLVGSATSSLLHNPFGSVPTNPDGSPSVSALDFFNAQTMADAADAQAMLAALRTLVHNGLDPKGALFQQLAASGNIALAQQMAALTSEQLFAEQANFNSAQGAAGAVGQFAGTQAFGPLIGETRDAVKEFRDEVRHLRRELNQFSKKAGENVKDGAHSGAYSGTHAGTTDANEGRKRNLRQMARTGGGL
jgi:hypothetical protein